MERLILRLENIEQNILNDPVFRTLTSSHATIPFLSLRTEQIIKSIVNGKRQQQLTSLYQQLDSSQIVAGSDIRVMKDLLADHKAQIIGLERTLLAKQDQLDIVVKSHKQQAELVHQKNNELDTNSKQINQLTSNNSHLKDERDALQQELGKISREYSQIEGEKIIQGQRLEEALLSLKKQTEKSNRLGSELQNLQQNLKVLKFSNESLEKQLRQTNKKLAQTQDNLSQSTNKLRKIQNQMKSQSEKLFEAKQKQQQRLNEIDNLREDIRIKEKTVKQMNEKNQQLKSKSRSASLKIDSLQRDKSLLEAQLSVQKDKEKGYQSKLAKLQQIQSANLELRQELLVIRSRQKIQKEQSEKLTLTFQATKLTYTEQIQINNGTISSLRKAVMEMEAIIRQQQRIIFERNHQLQDFTQSVRVSENKLMQSIQGVKSDKHREILKRDKKIQQLSNHIKVTQGKLIELTKLLNESEDKQKLLSRQLEAQGRAKKQFEQKYSTMCRETRKKLVKLNSLKKDLRSQLSKMKQEYIDWIRAVQSEIGRQTQIVLSGIRNFNREKDQSLEEVNRLFKLQMSQVQKMLAKRNLEHRKEIDLYKDEILHRERIINKAQAQISMERKNNLILRETLNNEAKVNVIKKLQYQKDVNEARQKLYHEQALNNVKLNTLEKRYRQVLQDSETKYRNFERKIEDMTARKNSISRYK